MRLMCCSGPDRCAFPAYANFSWCPQDATSKRHVSYGRRDIHIKEAEERLMTKYRMGYSQLHKYLVLKEGINQFSTPFL
jgi:hypothetical protein